MTDDWERLLGYSTHVTVDGTDVHHFDAGDGEPILLIHGGGPYSCAESSWGAVVEPLSEHCRVVAPDQPGFGFTDPRGDRDHYPRERADFLAKLIEELNLDPVTVVGNSRAGYQASYLALDRPDLVSKLVIVNAGSCSRKLAPNELPGALRTEEPTREGARREIERAREKKLINPEHHPFYSKPITDEKVDRFFRIQRRNWEFHNGRHEAVQNSAEALNDALSYRGRHITEVTPEIEQPTLITWSTQPYVGWPRTKGTPDSDELPPKLVRIKPETLDPYERDEGFDAGVRLFERIPNAELHVWHDALHMVMTDQVPGWVNVVADFHETSG
jgi:pimeloyl-ACP methyl ester carboxylesterase